MAHTLPELPYALDALEPHIDARTLEIHHGKHHAAYVSKLNAALEGHPDLQRRSIEDLIANLAGVPDGVRTAVRNNGGGHLNHSIYWKNMGPGGGGAPSGELAKAIKTAFGSFEAFKEKFSAAAAGHFGSGWAWLSVDRSGGLVVQALPNQDSPLTEGLTPILTLDVWEHAYYLKFQNRRPDFIAAFWSVVNWADVAQRFAKAS